MLMFVVNWSNLQWSCLRFSTWIIFFPSLPYCKSFFQLFTSTSFVCCFSPCILNKTRSLGPALCHVFCLSCKYLKKQVPTQRALPRSEQDSAFYIFSDTLPHCHPITSHSSVNKFISAFFSLIKTSLYSFLRAISSDYLNWEHGIDQYIGIYFVIVQVSLCFVNACLHLCFYKRPALTPVFSHWRFLLLRKQTKGERLGK